MQLQGDRASERVFRKASAKADDVDGELVRACAQLVCIHAARQSTNSAVIWRQAANRASTGQSTTYPITQSLNQNHSTSKSQNLQQSRNQGIAKSSIPLSFPQPYHIFH
jgi:hypothetical protein